MVGIKLEHSQLIFYRLNCQTLYVYLLEIGSHQQKGVGHVQEEVVGWKSQTRPKCCSSLAVLLQI